jgi:tRNA threonylcarbamoyladenosine biosynthesis protein TsaB
MQGDSGAGTYPAAMLVTLAIETSNPSAEGPGGPGVAVRAGATIVVEPVGRGREDDLMPAIDRVFRRAGCAPSALGLIAVSIGPGGFTALRVGVTVAKTLAYSCGAVCIGVPTSAALADRARRDGVRGRLAVLLASKGETSYASVFDEGAVHAREAQLIDAAQLAALGVGTVIADQFLPVSMRTACERMGIAVTLPHFDAADVLAFGASLHTTNGATPVDELAPIYAREPEAVTKWRQLHPDRAP